VQANRLGFDENREWNYVLRVYARRGVASACLLLQDRLGVDVVVMLHLAYVCMEHGVAMTDRGVAQADTAVRRWREEVVHPLRSARRFIKKKDDALKKLHTGLQEMELLAERYALARLEALPTPTNTNPMVSIWYSVLPVVAFYARRGGHMGQLNQQSVREAMQLLDEQLFIKEDATGDGSVHLHVGAHVV